MIEESEMTDEEHYQLILQSTELLLQFCGKF